MTDDLISRQAAIAQILHCENHDMEHDFEFNEGLIAAMNAIEELPTAGCEYWDTESNYCALYRPAAVPTAQPEQRWIPVKTRPMTEEERQYWEEHTGVELEAEDAVFFDCQMPDDGQEVWVCYKGGTVSEDVCESDDFCGLEGNGDWSDIVAWMPRIKPDPWKGEDEE